MSYNILTGNTYLSATAPIGSLAAYLSTTDPTGWIICDGLQRTNNSDGRYNNLNALGIGTGGGSTSSYTPPNLRGSFLRAIGTNGSYSGGTFKDFQQQKIINHGHGIADHSHTILDSGTTFYAVLINTSGSNTINNKDNSANEVDCIANGVTLNSASTTSASLTTGNSVTGVSVGNETRPYNYGVNWIIKY